MPRLPLLAALAVAVAVAAPATAAADGLPVVNIDAGPAGVAAGGTRYVTLGEPRGTVLAAIDRRSGRVERWRVLPSARTIPAVAFDGSPSGLSADGRTLVLIRPRLGFPQATTTLAVVDARTLAMRRTIRLRGDFSFDAISPDGRSLFFIHYLSPTDPSRYEVRAFDVASGRLARAPIVDPRERGEQMAGFPQTRATSADGRWAYTLYDGGTGAPFVHALDTSARRARCIDMPLLRNRDLSLARLVVRGQRLTVVDRHRSLAVVDTRTFAVRGPAAAAARAHGDAPAWRWVVLSAALLVAAAAVAAGRRRQGSMSPAQITASQASSSSIDAASRATWPIIGQASPASSASSATSGRATVSSNERS